jgi:hypothetical protein
MSGTEGPDRFTQLKVVYQSQIEIVHEPVRAASQSQGNAIRFFVSESRLHALAGCHFGGSH